MRRRVFLKASARVIACVALSPESFARLSPANRSEDKGIQRQLRFTVTLTNPKPYELHDQVIWLYMPAAETPTQKLDSIKVSMPYARQIDALGHTIISLVFPRFAPLSTQIITVVADVLMNAVPSTIPLASSEAWLRAERYIETTDPKIQSLAAILKRSETSATALAIYDWVKSHLHYKGYLADDYGAGYALNQLQGDCTEYAYLAVALARANGIPARMVGGYVTDKNTILRAADYHNWAEVYIDGTWRLLDAQKERWLTPTEHYVAFRFYRDEKINPIGLAHRYSKRGELEIKL
jgi:transglutaminase-like putative cysteine protease